MSLLDAKKDGEILTALADHLLDRFQGMLAAERAALIAELDSRRVVLTTEPKEKS